MLVLSDAAPDQGAAANGHPCRGIYGHFDCPGCSGENPIETDRPDITNSSIVVPVGSLQNENGINVSRRDGADVFDGSNSRWRLGIAPCFEVLIDVPNYVGTLRGSGASGFGDVSPAVKWQVSPSPGKFDLSVTVGCWSRRAALFAIFLVCGDWRRVGGHWHGDQFLHPG